MFRWLSRWLRNSSFVHARQDDIGSTKDLIALFDRFLNGPMRYPLEWDDFISWKSEIPAVEAIRLRICEQEALLFSGNARDRARYAELVKAERNTLARLLNEPVVS